ncbi:MAG: gliding motility-associated C-terminal domain-containing protein, partial [Bacteroidota bacterium]
IKFQSKNRPFLFLALSFLVFSASTISAQEKKTKISTLNERSSKTIKLNFSYLFNKKEKSNPLSSIASEASKDKSREKANTCNGVYTEQNGLVVIEAENTPSDYDLWILKTDVEDYKGTGHIEFTGNSITNGPPNSPLIYKFRINDGGEYQLILRARKRLETDRDDLSNDCYVRVEGDYGPGSNVKDGGDARLETLKEDTKLFGGNDHSWGIAQKLDVHGGDGKRNAAYTFKAGNEYTLVVSGRSKNFNLDRFMFFKKDSYSLNNAKKMIATEAESSCAGGDRPNDPPAPPVGLQAQALSGSVISLVWQDKSGNEEGFYLEKRVEGGDFIRLASLEANQTSYQDEGLEAEKSYTYRLQTFNQAGTSNYSNEARAETLGELRAFNLISPNGDGVNDVWNIENLGEAGTYAIRVFSKNGQLVYESQDYTDPWDGTMNGQVLPSGTYFYSIQVSAQKSAESGYLTLVY